MLGFFDLRREGVGGADTSLRREKARVWVGGSECMCVEVRENERWREGKRRGVVANRQTGKQTDT